MAGKRKHHCVLLLTTPEGWLPARVHSLPPCIVAAEYLEQHLRFPDAIKVARNFNKAHLPCRGTFDGRWAVVVKHLRASKTRDPQLIAQRKGGAA